MPGVYLQVLITNAIMNMRTLYFTLFGNKRGDNCIVGDYSPMLSSGTNQSHGETGVIRLRIIVHVAILQTLGVKGWSQLQYTRAFQMAMPFNITASGQAIIHPKPNIKEHSQTYASRSGNRHSYRMTITFIQWQDKRYRGHQKRGIL